MFFGRETEIDDLLRRLRSTRFLAVVGTSGSGKSSLVRSGLIPSLQSGYMAGATNIVIQNVCPSDFSEHIAMAIYNVAHQLVLNALDPAHAKPVVCGNGLSNYFG